MRIIRVSGCHDCPYLHDWYDKRSCIKNDYFKVGEYQRAETLPDNCPLEEVVNIITKVERDEFYEKESAK